jgi:hypothetical protein
MTRSDLQKSTKPFSRLVIGAAFGGALTVAVLQGQSNFSNNTQNTRVKISSQQPIAEYSRSLDPDPAKLAKRQIRDKKHDRSEWRVNPADVADSTVRVDYLDPNLPALPVKQSDAVLVGEVVDANTYLSDDKTGVYSEFSVRVEQVLKNDGTLTPACSIDIEREGGRVRFGSGKIHTYSIDKTNMPQIGTKYILFLKREGTDQAYHLLTGYELRADKVFPLDELPQFRTHQDDNKEAFMIKLSTVLAPQL